ncbi:universal stress protein [Halopelagius longus]|uniref:Universal stress protein n=1 Tax=Halopelagius longus TaxID=1236180 RepID=A0A1H1GM44_9EURY|nr:universal stress protein [Halopelagius longus]RDI69658.1 universal stress protein [Halopelagius longus]SDR14294.1 Nucleotide-binding universal stress protein, UspA family [Halopelagius longus]
MPTSDADDSSVRPTPLDDILVPHDTKKESVAAAGHAFRIAQMFDSTVHGLYAVESSNVLDGPSSDDAEYSHEEIDAIVRQELERQGDAALTQMADRAESRGVSFVREIRTASATQAILDYAEENDIDMIVMGKGRRKIDGPSTIGGDLLHVLQWTDIPVLTVSNPVKL